MGTSIQLYHCSSPFLLSNYLKDNNIPWENVYNMDEKGVQLGGGRKNSQI
ncbi:hypothetical protein C8J55DRAFT_424560 [Lentinula edodes]|uniref:Uncharacterized protein n=1 Tax=Lentinula lateritia TaxID=40482 RepID=A0A9W9APF3_9AGAR|nr:hypothetical protein C8J55DRAFT_424560 [Lentinula edodes]